MKYVEIISEGFEALYRSLLPYESIAELFLLFKDKENRDELLRENGVERIHVEKLIHGN